MCLKIIVNIKISFQTDSLNQFLHIAVLQDIINITIYFSIDETRPLYIVAELVSSAKKSLARMLLIIVSLGYGTVK